MGKSFWHEWRGSSDGRPSMFVRNLLSLRGFKLDLHKFIRADDPTCFHTHPAKALRVILWGGYTEQIRYEGGAFPKSVWYKKKQWIPGDIGIIQPELCHRIDWLRNGRASYSLWLRWPKSAEITIFGEC